MSSLALPRAAILTAGALWFVFTVVAAANPSPAAESLAWFLFAGWGVIGLAWLVEIIVTPARARSRRIGWFALPAFIVTAIALQETSWPLAARVWLSENALRERIADTHAHLWDQPPRDAALFTVLNEDRVGERVFFTTCLEGLDQGGIVYLPDGTMPPPGYGTWKGVKHLYGPWYRFFIID